MDNKADVRLVEPHAQSGRGNQCFHFIALQSLFGVHARVIRVVTAVGQNVKAMFVQEIGDDSRIGHRKAVNDARSWKAWQVRNEPREPGSLRRYVEDSQVEALAIEWASLSNEPCAKLRDNVFNDPIIRRCGAADDRNVWREPVDEFSDTPVVRSEVMAPVRNAVNLVDHEESGVEHQ